MLWSSSGRRFFEDILRPEEDQSIWSKRRQGFQPCCEAGIREPTLSFIPIVRKERSSLGLEQKAVLVLDNCSAHPNEEDFISDDGNISALFLLPNVTSLIQPKNQGVLVALKHCNKKKLLRRLLIEDENGTSTS